MNGDWLMPDYLSRDDLEADLECETIRSLEHMTYLVELDGSPCWEAGQVLELLDCPGGSGSEGDRVRVQCPPVDR